MFENIKQVAKNLFRKDNWANYMTSLGVPDSRTSSTRVSFEPLLDHYTLDAMHRNNGLAKKIVNLIVEDSLRNFIEADHELLQEMKRIKLKQTLQDACIFGRLFGGAIIVAFLDDGLEMDKPVNLKSNNKIISLKAFDKNQISWTPTDLNQNYNSENFGNPEFFTISSYTRAVNYSLFKVHASRCFLINGDHTTNLTRLENGSWDTSVIQGCFHALRNYGIVTDTSAEIIHDFVQGVLSMKELSEKMSKPGGTGAVQNRLRHFQLTRSVSNVTLVDAEGEKYEKNTSSVAGLADLWDRFSETICSVTGYPATKLFGKSPGGLNSTGVSDMKNYYDMVDSYRSDQIEPAINWIINLLESQKVWKKKPANFEWSFPSLITPSDLETAQIKEIYSKIDATYIDRAAIDASEAWQQRFGQEKFNINITLSEPKKEEVESDVTEEDKKLLEEIVLKDEDIIEEKETKKKIKKITDSLLKKTEKW